MSFTKSIVPDNNDDDDEIFRELEGAEAADLKPVPKGLYIVVALSGELTKAKTGTKGYNVAFRIIEGEYTGRRLWRTWHLTAAAIPYTKTALAQLGIKGEGMKAQMERPLPAERFVCKAVVVIRTGDDGIERNEISSIELLRVQEPPTDPFTPPPVSGPPASGPPPVTPAAESLFDDDPSAPSSNAGKAERQ